MARPKNRSEARQIALSLPIQTHDYLVALAVRGKLGVTEQAVAEHILTERVEEMMASGYHNIRPPDPA
jgi:hypothetical protein